MICYPSFNIGSYFAITLIYIVVIMIFIVGFRRFMLFRKKNMVKLDMKYYE